MKTSRKNRQVKKPECIMHSQVREIKKVLKIFGFVFIGLISVMCYKPREVVHEKEGPPAVISGYAELIKSCLQLEEMVRFIRLERLVFC